MEEIDYKKLDEDAIYAFLEKSDGEVDVPDIIAHSGANKLRVYNILFEMTMHGQLEVTRQTELGTPEAVRLIQ